MDEGEDAVKQKPDADCPALKLRSYQNQNPAD